MGVHIENFYMQWRMTLESEITEARSDRFTGLKMARFKLCEGAESIGGVREAGYWTVV